MIHHFMTSPCLRALAARRLRRFGFAARLALAARLATVLAFIALPAIPIFPADCGGFRRGDSNSDEKVDLSDGVYSLGYLFLGGPAPGCLDASDSNDDGKLDIADPIYELAYLFSGGTPPPAPGAEACGPDPTVDALTCASYPCPPLPECGCSSNADCEVDAYCEKSLGDCEGVGECIARPLGCPDNVDPVCGCDNATYSNACDAAAAGVSLASLGACVVTVPCSDNAGCDLDEYCRKDEGDCLGAGACATRPVACPAIFKPVCGCDGATYSNDCEAAGAGVNVAHQGPCEPMRCSSNEDCDALDQLCLKEMGACEGDGVCAVRPGPCPENFDPVCGCDGVTYGNVCEALAAGVSVASAGACPPPPDCDTNADCPPGSFCKKAEGDCGGKGVCTERPTVCPDVFDPVCGCDGVTYGNECDANAAGASVKHRGECSAVVLCSDDRDVCDVDAYCRKDPGDCLGAGVCTIKPIVCPDVFDPVCGCNGVTYGNECEASAAGVSVEHSGECAVALK